MISHSVGPDHRPEPRLEESGVSGFLFKAGQDVLTSKGWGSSQLTSDEDYEAVERDRLGGREVSDGVYVLTQTDRPYDVAWFSIFFPA